MKQLLAIVLCCLLSVPTDGQTLRAFMVAVDQYPEGNGFGPVGVVSLAPDGNYYGLLTYALCATESGTRAEVTVAGFFDLLSARIEQLSEGCKRLQITDLQSANENKTFDIGR